MKAALYLRTSKNDQHPENQMPSMERYCYDRGYVVKGVFIEQESAWKAGHQAELARLLAEIRDGKRRYDIVLCWALDRLTRGGAAAILNLVDSFHAYGTKVISLQEPWTELPGELGEVLYSIAGWVARMESQRRSERTKAGLARVMASGVTKTGRKITKLGRPKGAKDKNGRRKAGYLNRWMVNKGARDITPVNESETSGVN